MSRSKYANAGYSAIRSITEQSIRSRRALAIGRDGERVKPRRFHLDSDTLSTLKAEFKETGKVPNPFNKGAYHFILASLLSLGMDQKHKLAAVQTRFRELMSDPSTRHPKTGKTAWQRFRDKEPAGSEETSLDASDRFEQNIRVLQRFGGFTPYGLKLLEVGTRVCGFKGLVIDLLRSGTGEVYVRLNSESKVPTNELKVRNVQPKPVKRVKRKARATTATAPAPAAETAETAVATA